MIGLHNCLAGQKAATQNLFLGFAYIEAANGHPLPPSALSGNSWGWTNADCSRSRWWTSVGWRVWRVDHSAKMVEFRRMSTSAAADAALPKVALKHGPP